MAPGICEGIAERGFPISRITSIPNACDLELFHPQRKGLAKKPELIAGLTHSIPPGSFVAAFTGAHGLANGLDAVLDVAVELQRWGHDIQLLFIGDGRCKPDSERRVVNEALRIAIFCLPSPSLSLQILSQSVHVGLMVLDDVPVSIAALHRQVLRLPCLWLAG